LRTQTHIYTSLCTQDYFLWCQYSLLLLSVQKAARVRIHCRGVKCTKGVDGLGVHTGVVIWCGVWILPAGSFFNIKFLFDYLFKINITAYIILYIDGWKLFLFILKSNNHIIFWGAIWGTALRLILKIMNTIYPAKENSCLRHWARVCPLFFSFIVFTIYTVHV